MKYFKRDLQSLPAAERKDAMPEAPIYKQRERVGEDENGAELFRMTDSAPDREGDIILSAGMRTDQWEQYGSVLWGHSAATPDLVLGAPLSVIRGEASIDAAIRFATQEENPTGAMVHRMIRSGLVQAGSVGILIEEWSDASDRVGFFPINIIRSELMEFSITPIPANPRAVRQEFESDEEVGEVIELIERTVEEVCPVTETEKDLASECLRFLTGQRTYSVPAATADLAAAAFLNRLLKGE